MRHHEAGFGDPFTAVKNQIQIQRSWGAWHRAISAVFSLDVQERVEQRPGAEGRLTHHDSVQKARLIAHAYWRGLDPRGVTEIGENRCQPADAERQVAFAIAQIAPQRDRNRGRRYSTQRVPITIPG